MWITAFFIGQAFIGSLQHCYYSGGGRNWETVIPAGQICPLTIQVPVG